MTTIIPPAASSGLLARLVSRVQSEDGADRRVVPFRGELLGAEHLAEHARAVGRRQRVGPGRAVKGSLLLVRLRDNQEVLEDTREALHRAAEEGRDVTAAGEWLLDNFHVVQDQIREVRASMPRGYYRELPKLTAGALEGYPRVYEIAIELIAHTEGHLHQENISLFVREFQRTATLSMGELWAVPAMLRLGLIENIRRLAVRVVRHLGEIESADAWADRLRVASESSSQQMAATLATFVADHPRLTPTFVSRFLQRIRSYQRDFKTLLWLEQWIAEEGPSGEDARISSSQRLALSQVMIANSITSLRTISRLDWETFFESQSATEFALRRDPSGHYAAMTFESRDRYRHEVERLARATAHPEEAVAAMAVDEAERAKAAYPDQPWRAHAGYYLVDDGVAVVERALGYHPKGWIRWRRLALRHPTAAYFGSIALVLAGVLAAVASLTGDLAGWRLVLVMGLALIPASEVAIAIVQQLVALAFPPRTLPRLEFRETGIPAEARTVVVVPTLLASEEAVREALDHLEVQYLANRAPQLYFALLGDFTDAERETVPGDDAIVDAAIRGVRELNRRYGGDGSGSFLYFHRPRRWNAAQKVWMGWERKRGKLDEFNQFLLHGERGAFSTIAGDAEALRRVRFVITLDADSVLPRDAAALLVGTLAHPLNRPVTYEYTGQVIRGYAILQPRVSISLTSAHESLFAAIHSGRPGVDPYTTAVSDVYQDLFGEGSYTGKGIYDVAAFDRATHAQFPDNALLSHDLIEGAYSRAGLVTDVELFDDYPTLYTTWTMRKHRWIRGDWQLLPWLGRRVPTRNGRRRNPMSAISRWKLLDNLRRSLVEASQFLLLLAGWTLLPGSPLAWTLVATGSIAGPWLVALAFALVRPPAGKALKPYYAAVGRDAWVSVQQVGLALVFLPHQAAVSVDAIVRTLWRRYVTGRLLLEWATASQVERLAWGLGRGQPHWKQLWLATFAAVSASALVAWTVVDARRAGDAGLALLVAYTAAPLLAIWLVLPELVRALGRPATVRELDLAPGERAQGLRYALLHWQFYERFVGPETRWLAPDNFQLEPEPTVAFRTSPTNIGLQLLSTVTARDFGFITNGEMVERLEHAFESMRAMRRHRGHFFNWYELDELRVLEPAYVSTVDSGNLAGHLLAMSQACLESLDMPVDHRWWIGAVQAGAACARAGLATALEGMEPVMWSRELQHAEEALDVLVAGAKPPHAPGAKSLADLLRAVGVARERLRGDEYAESRRWLEWTHALLLRHQQEQAALAVEGEGADRTLAGHAAHAPVAADLTARLQALAREANRYALDMDFRFLFDPQRKLFAIGWSEHPDVLDSTYYDLLASEARLASYVAIAKGDVSVEHWFRLGRALSESGGDTALVSWSGSMFEYLMPCLVMRSWPGTLLDQTYHGAVARQVTHGREMGIPWGTSESAYNLRDRQGTYQYRAFGVSDLALKRGLSKDLVVAPYASLLALLVEPHAAFRNLAQLEQLGALGALGFMEAVDFTRPRRGERYAVVSAWMSHHVGMGMVALADALNERVWQRRFHADPIARSAELLLQERIPRRFVPQEVQPAGPAERVAPTELERPPGREHHTPDTREPRIALLGSLPYAVMVSNAGAGWSRAHQLTVTRWRADATADDHGQWCYVKDVHAGTVWSATHQPVCRRADRYHVTSSAGRVRFERSDGDIDTQLDLAVVPNDQAEVRCVTVTNSSFGWRVLELTSYGEVVLSHPDADRAHPAFGNLFIQTEWVENQRAILAHRRPREPGAPEAWLVHTVAFDMAAAGDVSYETDRARFIGRGRTVRSPAALDDGHELSGTVGAVLDPIFAIRVRLRLGPGATATVAFTTLVASSRDRALELADRYNDAHSAQRAHDLSWTHTQVELQDLGISAADAELFQQLAGHLLYPHPALRASPHELEASRRGQESLWSMGISGDVPLLLASIDSRAGLPTVRQLLAAHQYLRLKNVAVDLLFLNTRPGDYMQELNDQLLATLLGSSEAGLMDRPGGVFLRRADLLAAEDVALLRSVARVQLLCDGLGLGDRIDLPDVEPDYAAPLEPAATSPRSRPGPHDDGTRAGALSRRWPNGVGGINARGEFEMDLVQGGQTPAPWANVVANPLAGFSVTESGGGFAWAGNSHFFRLTPWRNDPVTDAPGEVLYLRDDETGEVWSATPAPVRHGASFTVRHGQGYSVFRQRWAGIESVLTLAMAPGVPVKVATLDLVNERRTTCRLTLTSYVEWVLGVLREHTAHQVRVRWDEASMSLFARNYFDPAFADRVAFSAISETVTSHTADRREFVGRNGTLSRPAALDRRGLGETTSASSDPCAALQCRVSLEPREHRRIVVLLGTARGEDEARHLIARYGAPPAATEAITASSAEWDRRLSAVEVHTPDPEFDQLVNRWLPYQTLSCRLWGRSATYQSSGAYGFRDQLQDSMAMVYAEPALAREHILRAAGRQFVEGDVQHWWHPHSGRGIRTRFSDDPVWLPWVVEHYVRTTGDHGILDEVLPYLSMRTLAPGEHEVYDLPAVSSESAPLYEHCALALRVAATIGEHGLPLIGTGDWNDGMNRVGIQGKGESVWLAWFLIAALRSFAELAEHRGDAATAADFRRRADDYVVAVEEAGWDGGWYRRAYFDDGTPLGSAQGEECRIDSIAQSWSVLSGAGRPERARQAMQAVYDALVRKDARVVMLLAPPFDVSPLEPGYIKGYLPGVRENGAQYTHAALWAALAMLRLGDGDRGWELFEMLNPLTHARTPGDVATYKVEPYVVAADVYTAEGHLGRGGWTWYTGAAAWMYRVALEGIMGLQKRGTALRIDPCLPSRWPEARLTWRHEGTTYDIVIRNPHGACRGVASVTVDGEPSADGSILLATGRERVQVTVTLGPAEGR